MVTNHAIGRFQIAIAAAGDLALRHARLLPLGRLDMRPKLVQYFKAAMDIAGREGGACRPPRLELTADERREVEEAVRALGAGVAG